MENIVKDFQPKQKTKLFQIRWKEGLGEPGCPYVIRWVFIFFGYSIRIHHWFKSDDLRYQHCHAWDFITFVLKGYYTDISDDGEEIMSTYKLKYRKAEHKHCVKVDAECWTILFTGRPKRNWGFWVNNKMFRPLRYFNKFGQHYICE